MTNEQWIDLGKRAVACKGWRWMPGMLVRKGDWRRRIDDGWVSPAVHGAWPDFRDPSTLGCLLALVREAKGDPCWQVLCLGDEVWSIEGADYPTEGEAHVAALEAADD